MTLPRPSRTAGPLNGTSAEADDALELQAARSDQSVRTDTVVVTVKP